MKTILIFDYDGTLADSFHIVLDVMKQISKKHNLTDVDVENLRKFFEFNIDDALDNWGKNSIKKKLILADLLIHLRLQENKIKLFSNVKSTLNKLSKKYDMYIVTSNFARIVNKKLKQNNINVFIDVLGLGAGRSKVKKINLIKEKYPKDTTFYFIGDTVADMKEAKETKIKTIASTYGYHEKERLQKLKPDFYINEIKDLLEIL
jgi:phosphoglycolate phosphatase